MHLTLLTGCVVWRISGFRVYGVSEGIPTVFLLVWNGYENWNPVPMAALLICRKRRSWSL